MTRRGVLAVGVASPRPVKLAKATRAGYFMVKVNKVVGFDF